MYFSVANNHSINKLPTQYHNAISFLKENKYKSAIKEAENFVTDNPQHSLALNAYLIIGESYLKLNNYKKVEDIKKILIEHYLHNTKIQRFFFNLGYWYIKKEKYSKALELNEYFLESFPESKLVPRILMNSAVCYYHISKYKKAIEIYEDILQKYPDSEYSAVARKYINQFYSKSKNNSMTISEYNKYRVLHNPNNLYYKFMYLFSSVPVKSLIATIAIICSIVCFRKYKRSRKRYYLLYLVFFISMVIIIIELIILYIGSIKAYSITNKIMFYVATILGIIALITGIMAERIRRKEKTKNKTKIVKY